MFQNLTRCFAPVLNSELMSWAGTQSDMWVRLDEEAAYVSAWVGLAELALGGCTLTTDDLYAHPRPKLIDAEIAAAREVGFRFDPCRGGVALGRDDGLIFPAELVQDRDTIMADTERLIGAYHDRSPHAMTRIVAGPSGSSVATPGLMEAAAELAERHDVRMTTHLSQFAGEEEWSLGYFGMRQVDWLESVGWGSSRAWVAHCIFVTDEEIARLARWGVGVAHCPTTCCLVADGVTPGRRDAPRRGRRRALLRRRRLRARLDVARGAHGAAARPLPARAGVDERPRRARAGDARLGALPRPRGAQRLPRRRARAATSPCGRSRASRSPARGPTRSRRGCAAGPVSTRHTVIAGKAVVRDGELRLPQLDEMLRRHERISREWQAAVS